MAKSMFLSLCGGLIVAGCQHAAEQRSESPEPSESVATASTVPLATPGAAEPLARTRCDREQRCNNIGPNSAYSSYDVCLKVLLPPAQGELKDCQRGIDEQKFQACLADISRSECGQMLPLEQIMTCRVSDLCQG